MTILDSFKYWLSKKGVNSEADNIADAIKEMADNDNGASGGQKVRMYTLSYNGGSANYYIYKNVNGAQAFTSAELEELISSGADFVYINMNDAGTIFWYQNSVHINFATGSDYAEVRVLDNDGETFNTYYTAEYNPGPQ